MSNKFLAGEYVTTRRYQLTLGQGVLSAGDILKLDAGKLVPVDDIIDDVFGILVNDQIDLVADAYVDIYVKGTFLGAAMPTPPVGTWEDYFVSARQNQLLLIENKQG